MNKNIRNTTIFAILLAVVFLNVTIDAHAAELADRAELTSAIGTSAFSNIQNSGDNANVENNTNKETSQNVNNTNEATVLQNVNAVANTGHNIAERNIAIGGNAGMISTGDAAVATAAQLNTNNNATVLKGDTTSKLTLSQLTNTGDNITANTSADTKQLTAVQNNNKTTVIQNGNASANTGENYAPRNISIGGQAGVIQTGNAYTGTSLLLAGNGNVALIGGETDANGPGSGASIVMTNTGDRVRATDQFRNQSQSEIYNQNLLSIAQSCYECTVNTGNNASNRNINTNGNAGVIQTGNAIIGMSMALQGNMSVNDIGTTVTNNNQLNNVVNAGDDSQLISRLQNDTRKSVQNNNQTSVSQKMNAYANTGHNEASRNIALGGNAGLIQTGSAYILTLLNVSTNQNITQ